MLSKTYTNACLLLQSVEKPGIPDILVLTGIPTFKSVILESN